ncbi:SulP family inorganic anion transporter [Desulfobacterales bacterium HSG17]|nr:SulP family inorganic anion transporter [Desulfobacterales bacterium HSG17]
MKRLFTNIKGDLSGGFTAGLIPLPRAIALGALVFSPLGPEYLPIGIVAGVISSAVSNIGAAPIGGLPFMNNAPFSLSAIMLLGALDLIINRLGGIGGPESAMLAVGFLFLTVFMSGALQIFFGLLKVGDFAKYIPYPVLAGLINGTAIIIILTQINTFFGLDKNIPLTELVFHIDSMQPLTLLVGLVVCLAIWFGPKLNKSIPTPVYGIACGVACYYALANVGLQGHLGPVLGAIPGTIPLPRYAPQFISIISDRTFWPLLVDLFLLSMGIGAIVSLRSMLVCTAAETLSNERYNSNKELIGQGVGNMLCGLFGGINGAGSLASTLSNYKFGGRTQLSRIASGLFPLMVLLALHPLVALIPKVVLAGMLIMIAISSFDKWSLDIIRQLAASLKNRDFDLAVNLILVFIVTLVLLVFGIFEALGVGSLISVFWLIHRMSKSIIRQEFTAQNVHSNTYRSEKETLVLEEQGKRIYLLELEGTLFFGTADKISERVDQLIKQEVQWIIIHFGMVGEIDSTGAKLISQLISKCRQQGVMIYLAGLKERQHSYHHRQLFHILTAEQRQQFCFQDRDIALDEAEEQLLDQFIGNGRYENEIPLKQISIFDNLAPGQVSIIEPYLNRRNYSNQEYVFRQGEPGNSIFLAMQGRARIILGLDDGTQKRIRTLCPGTVIGEMAILNHSPRSADVLAQGELICYELHFKDLMILHQKHPEISYGIIAGIARELSSRLRISSHLTANP